MTRRRDYRGRRTHRAAGLFVAAVILASSAWPIAAMADETVNACGTTPNEIFGHAAVFGINTYENCQVGAGAYLEIANAGNTVAAGQRASWQASAPAGLLIKDVTIPAFQVKGVDDGKQYGGGFYWHAGGTQVYDGAWSGAFGVNYGDSGFPSSYFGFQMICGANPCSAKNGYFYIEQGRLNVEETTGPTLNASGLWGQQGWLRGDWSISVSGDSPSGVCALSAAIDGQSVASQSFPQDTSAWHQCNAAGDGGMTGTVHTTEFSDGSHQLTIHGSDAAGLNTGSSYATTIHVDNSRPAISLSGPVDAPSTTGTQYVTAMAAAARRASRTSCVAWIAVRHRVSGRSAQVPVSGIGTHSVSCHAQDNAVDPSGAHGARQRRAGR